MNVIRLHDAITLAERALPGDYGSVRAVLVTGSRHRVAVDTLCSPADMAPFAGATLAIYTHADWDHCWGTAAFPGIPVIGHRNTRHRMMGPEEAATLAEMRAAHPDAFAGARLLPPSITFVNRLEVDAGGITLRLQHVPGHTLDSIWVFLPEREVLLAGDVAEEPFPSLGVPGSLEPWARTLRRWSTSAVKQVVPAHGRVTGPELLAQNAEYIEALLERGKELLGRGMSLAEIQAALPITRFFPEADRYPAYYHATHRENVAAALAEVQRG